jgi:GMP synthase (glutamine-hydrolysing)
MRPRLALLDASHGETGTRRNFRRELDADLVEYAATEGDLPDPERFGSVGRGGRSSPSADFDRDGSASPSADFDGVVVTGSRASVYWDEEWIGNLVDRVADAHDRGLPILGVCFGHQVLAEALGGRVEGMDRFEIGYNEVRRTTGGTESEERPADGGLLAGVGEEFTVFTTHGDRVVDLPPGASTFAENEYGVHGFRVGEAYGVQFHPEYDPETAREVTRGKEDRLGSERVSAVLEGITEENFAAACEAKTLFDNFLDRVERTAGDGPSERGAACPSETVPSSRVGPLGPPPGTAAVALGLDHFSRPCNDSPRRSPGSSPRG